MAGMYRLMIESSDRNSFFLAGASMVHPNVPAIVICPICPHSLSFRPIVVPAGIELTVKVPEDTRLTAWLSIDGRNRLELSQQDR